jgi:hypothetical protein
MSAERGREIMNEIGRTTWAIAGGRIPLQSTGHEPEFTSRDEIAVLNTGSEEARLEITFFHADRDPVGPYRLKVLPRRVRCVRVNDLINPEAVPLDSDYGCLVQSNVPVVVQFNRLDTSRPENAILTTMGFPVD